MKKSLFFFIVIYALHNHASACNTSEITVASCTLPGKIQRKASFCLNKKNSGLYYAFEKGKQLELKVEFSPERKLKRWIDQWTYTTYFGFRRGEYDYIFAVPEEKPNAVAFLSVKKDGKPLSLMNCNSNSFGEKDIQSPSIEDVFDATVRDNGFKFP